MVVDDDRLSIISREIARTLVAVGIVSDRFMFAGDRGGRATRHLVRVGGGAGQGLGAAGVVEAASRRLAVPRPAAAGVVPPWPGPVAGGVGHCGRSIEVTWLLAFGGAVEAAAAGPVSAGGKQASLGAAGCAGALGWAAGAHRCSMWWHQADVRRFGLVVLQYVVPTRVDRSGSLMNCWYISSTSPCSVEIETELLTALSRLNSLWYRVADHVFGLLWTP